MISKITFNLALALILNLTFNKPALIICLKLPDEKERKLKSKKFEIFFHVCACPRFVWLKI